MAKIKVNNQKWHKINELYFRANLFNNNLKYVLKDAKNAKSDFIVGYGDFFKKKNQAESHDAMINNMNAIKFSEVNTKDYNLRITR